MKLTAQFKLRCEAISTDLRAKLGKQAFDPLPAALLVAHLGVVALPPQSLTHLDETHKAYLSASTEWSAGIFMVKPKWVIIYNPCHAPTRHEANLMHEFGHILLAHPMIGIDPHTGFPLRNPQHEAEATYLGSCLQIPRRGLAWAVQQGYSTPQIAAHFGASEAMVRYRCHMARLKPS